MSENYPIILEQGATSWGAYAPDLPVCVAVGDTAAEALRLMRGAVRLYLEELAEDGVAPPLSAVDGRAAVDLSCEIRPALDSPRLLLLDDFPADWGSPFTWVDGELLAELGVAAERRRRLPLPSGGTAVRAVGYVRIRAGGKETVDEVVFAKKKDASAVGARALLGLQVAPPGAGKLRGARAVRAVRLAAAA